MAINYTDIQKTEKYISRANFDTLEMAAVPEGTEFNIVDQIHESDLDSDVLQKLNNNAKTNTVNSFTAAQTFKKDITIEGNIIQNGSTYETHAEKLYTKNDMIFTRDGATAALADDTYTGIQAVKYDGENDGQLVFGKDGVARVGNIGNTQPLATRAEKDALTDGHLLQWDATEQTLIDSGKSISELGSGDVTAAGDNTFTGNNTFESNSAGNNVITFNAESKFNLPLTTNAYLTVNGSLYLESNDLEITGKTVKFQEKAGTVALTSDIPDVSSFVENNTPTDFSVYDDVSGDKTTISYNAVTLEDPTVNNTCMLSAAGLVHKQMSSDGQITLHNTTLAFANNGDTTTVTIPNKTGTVALTSDIPDTTNFAKLNADNTFTSSITSKRVRINASNAEVTVGSSSGTYVSYGEYISCVPASNASVLRYSFPYNSGTLALTSDIPIFAYDSSTGTLSITLNN